MIVNSAELGELAGELLGRGAALRVRARGGSMAPFIHDGDVVTIEPVTDRGVLVGDVVLYRTAAGGLVAHRVLRKIMGCGAEALLVRGDATSGPYDQVLPEQVLGKVVSLERDGAVVRLDSWHRRLGALLLTSGVALLRRVRGRVRRHPRRP
jgi:signal peptidase I